MRSAGRPRLQGIDMSGTIRPVLTGQKALDCRRRQRPVDRLWLRQGVWRGRRRPGCHLAERARAAARGTAGEGAGRVHHGAAGRFSAGRIGGAVRHDRGAVGTTRHPGAFDRICAEGRSAGRAAELLRRGVFQGDGHFLPFVRPHGEAGGAADDRRRLDVCHELLRRQPRGAELQRDGAR